MFRKCMILIAVLASVWPYSSMARESNEFYIGGGVGKAHTSLNTGRTISNYPDITSNSNIDGTSTAYRVFGGYKFNQHLNAEADLTHGDAIIATESGQKHKLFDVNLLSFSALLVDSLGQNFRYYGKLGAFYWNLNEKSTTTAPLDDGSGLAFGAGMDINIFGDNNRRIRIDWMRYRFDKVYLYQMDVYSVNILFRLK